jgi:hypothetical protein
MIVTFNKETMELELNLPDELKEYSKDLYAELIDEYGFEPINKNSLEQMNVFVKEWFEKKGIAIDNK